MSGTRSFILAIDHRASFRRWAAGCTGTTATAETLARLKLIAAAALAGAVGSVDRSEMAMLVDDEYGCQAIELARSAGIKVVVPAERSGMAEFMFEHGEGFGEAVGQSGADAVKALVRYNPSSDPDRNARSRRRLVQLAHWCDGAGYPLMLELLVPPGPAQVDEAGEPTSDYDSVVRPALTCAAIEQLRAAGLSPAWWKLEGQPSKAAFGNVARATGADDGETGTSCLVLGRGADVSQLSTWIEEAAATAGFSGFAVGRSLWAGPLGEVLLGGMTARAATAAITSSYLRLVRLYERAALRAAAEPSRIVAS